MRADPKAAGADRANDRPRQSETTSHAVSIPDQGVERKAFLTLQAIAALHGFTLLQTGDGSFTIGRWGLLRQLGALDDAVAFLQRAGVRS